MPVYCLIRLSGATMLLDLATALVALSLFLFSLTHCIETRGWWRALAMLGVAFAIALTMEYLGSAHGILFGNYDYTNRLGPKAFGEVPVIIPAAWFMMLYPAWETAGLLTQRIYTEKRRNGEAETNSFFVPSLLRVVIAALAMTAWDISLDPRMAADGAWIWHDGGPYFGIPLTNFVGWLVTSAMIYAVWTKLERKLVILSAPRCLDTLTSRWRVKNPARISMTNTHVGFSPIPFLVPRNGTGITGLAEPQNDSQEVMPLPVLLAHTALPVFAYIVQWLGESMANALFWGGPLVAACVFVGMGVFAVPAAWRLLNPHTRRA